MFLLLKIGSPDNDSRHIPAIIVKFVNDIYLFIGTADNQLDLGIIFQRVGSAYHCHELSV